MKAIKVIFPLLIFIGIFNTLIAASSPYQTSDSSSIEITNIENQKSLTIYKGELIRIRLRNGRKIQGPVLGFQKGILIIDNELIRLDSVKSIFYGEKLAVKSKKKIAPSLGLGLGIVGLVLGIASIIGLYNLDSGSIIGDILLFLVLLPIGIVASFFGVILFFPSLVWLINNKPKKFKLGKKIRTKMQ